MRVVVQSFLSRGRVLYCLATGVSALVDPELCSPTTASSYINYANMDLQHTHKLCN
jgi:hypothetical protein